MIINTFTGGHEDNVNDFQEFSRIYYIQHERTIDIVPELGKNHFQKLKQRIAENIAMQIASDLNDCHCITFTY